MVWQVGNSLTRCPVPVLLSRRRIGGAMSLSPGSAPHRATAVIRMAVADAVWQPPRHPRTKAAAMFHGRRMGTALRRWTSSTAVRLIGGVMQVDWMLAACALGSTGALAAGLRRQDVGHRYPQRRRRAASSARL